MKPPEEVKEALRRLRILLHRPSFHEPVIDGIRAIAILWVLILHILFFHFGTYPDRVKEVLNSPWTSWIGRGDLGVDMFFVISGFLIGTILLKEYQKTDRINMRRFYLRRFLRLIPVYAVVMLMGLYFLRNIPKSAILVDINPSANASNAWANLLYVNNLLSIRDQYMGWCWSLAIEEQFYLIAPILLLILMKSSRHPLAWMLALLAISGFLRLAIIRTYDFTFPFTGAPDTNEWALRFDVIYDKLHVRYGGLLAGVMGAYVSLHHSPQIERWIGTPGRTNSILIAAVCLTACLTGQAMQGNRQGGTFIRIGSLGGVGAWGLLGRHANLDGFIEKLADRRRWLPE